MSTANKLLYLLVVSILVVCSVFDTSNAVSTTDLEETKCCKVGQESATKQGHCLHLNFSSVKSPSSSNQTPSLEAPNFDCELTAKLCCLEVLQTKLCRRVSEDIFDQEAIANLLDHSIVQRGNLIEVQPNVTDISAVLKQSYRCDTLRNTEAQCCLGCHLGIDWVGRQLVRWRGQVEASRVAALALDHWCASNRTEPTLGRTVSDSVGFGLCCRHALRVIRQNVQWCDLRPAPCAHRCHETLSDAGQVQCSCYDGYRLATDGRACVDIDECDERTHNCDAQHERCHNTPGKFQCLERKTDPETDESNAAINHGCATGTYFNTTEQRCKDEDECQLGVHDCDLRLQVCRNLLGSFQCVPLDRNCPSGFRLDHSVPSKHGAILNCVDINECAESTFDCDTRQEQCENFIGSYTCEPKQSKTKQKTSDKLIEMTTSTESTPANQTDPRNCAHGYHFVRFTFQCEDMDECRIGQHNCNLSREKCINLPGSFRCVQRSERELAAVSAANKLVKTLPLKRSCEPGYERNIEFDICEDIDECSAHADPCPVSNSYCQNILGSFVCHCKTGYIKQNGSDTECIDLDECAEGLHHCYGSAMTCENTIGSFHCVQKGAKPVAAAQCGPGQTFDHQHGRCVHGNGHEREEHDGSEPSGTSSRRALRCSAGERIVNGECRPIECGTGFHFNVTQDRCQDVNECLTRRPCRASERCTNTVGSFRCTLRCNPGYRSVAGGLACEDIDECALSHTNACGPHQRCTNVPGSYVCRCPSGFTESATDATQCDDVDECAAGADDSVCGFDSRLHCVNTPGSFRCECREGYMRQEASDGGDPQPNSHPRCVDIDECGSASLNHCQQVCYNYAGSYKCACKSGYRLSADGHSCDDVDECEHFQARALNGRNEPKYRRSTNGSVGDGGNNQLCYFKCVNQLGSFQCICPPGYESLSGGQVCKDIDECESDRHCRGQNEYCLNVRGSYRCNVINCPDGYYLEVTSRKCLRHMDGMQGVLDVSQPLSYTYNYLSVVSNMPIPNPPGYVDLLAMSGPIFSVTGIQFDLSLRSAKSAQTGVELATREHFLLRRPEYNRIVVALVRPLQGPQDIELELVVSLYSDQIMGGSTKASITIVVSEYEF